MFGKKKTDEDVLTDEVQTNAKAETQLKRAEAPAVLSLKEMKKLKNNRYEEKSEQYSKSFVIKNKRTGMIVELRAASALQAANFIGWRPRHTILIKEKDVSVEKEAQGKIKSADKVIEEKKENCPALQ